MSEEEVELTLEQLQRKLEDSVKRNVALEGELRKLGVQPNHFVIINLRLNKLMEFLMDERQRFEYEIEVSDELTPILLQIEQEVLAERERQRLILPAPQTQLPPGIKF